MLPRVAITLALGVPPVLLALARRGGAVAFPLDDAWIHLTFARNLARLGTLSYFPGDHASGGSTAPLFASLEALGFLITSNERVIGLSVGLAGYAAFLLLSVRDASRGLAHPALAALLVALLAGDGRFGIMAVSGMETTWFMAALALVFAAWRSGDARLAGVGLAAAVWTRPEALLLVPILVADASLARRRPRRWLAGSFVFAVALAGYLAFHRWAGPGWLPDTLAAKSAYYGGRPLGDFLRDDVASTFGGAWLLLGPFVLYALWRALREVTSRESRAPRVELAWACGLVLAYAIVLPYAHRFQRYLLPALSAYAFAGLWGAREWVTRVRRPSRALLAVTGGALLLVQFAWFLPAYDGYALASRYHESHHVRAGRWLAAHTARGAVIATHDIGAIGFESGRRVVDMAGLVTPEAIPHLRRPDYLPFLEDLFRRRRVSFLAVLEDWQSVDDAVPVFDADPGPPRLRVYDWGAGHAHLVRGEIVAAEQRALADLRAGRDDDALSALEAAVTTDPRAGTAWSLAGAALDHEGRHAQAESAFRTALALFPDLADARFGLGEALLHSDRPDAARAQLDSLRRLAPAHPGVAWLEARLPPR